MSKSIIIDELNKLHNQTQAYKTQLNASGSTVYSKTDTASIRERELLNKSSQAVWSEDQPFILNPNKEKTGFDLKPATSSGKHKMNIVDDYAWTLSKFRSEVPRIRLVEKQISSNQHLAAFFNNINKTLKTTKDPYEALYADAKETGFEYTLPYISESAFAASSTWSKQVPESANTYGGMMSTVLGAATAGLLKVPYVGPVIGSMLGKRGADGVTMETIMASVSRAGGALSNDPYTGIEQPAYFQGPTTYKYTVVFPLFNTIDESKALENYNFVRILTHQNLFNRKSFTTYDPPVIYECFDVAGYSGALGHKPAMVISDLKVKNIGTVRAMKFTKSANRQIVIPEAYLITIVLTELIANSRQIFSSFFTNDSIVNVGESVESQERKTQAEKDAIRIFTPNSSISGAAGGIGGSGVGLSLFAP